MTSTDWWTSITDAGLSDMVNRLAPLMRHRDEGRRRTMLELNLADLTAQREMVVTGPDGQDLPIATYRDLVENAIAELLRENPVLQRIQSGQIVSEDDLRSLSDLLRRQDPGIDEERLRKVYDVRRADFLQLMRHVLGVERLERWPTFVAREFDQFIALNSAYSALQLRFLRTLRTFVLNRARLDRADLVGAPFTQEFAGFSHPLRSSELLSSQVGSRRRNGVVTAINRVVLTS